MVEKEVLINLRRFIELEQKTVLLLAKETERVDIGLCCEFFLDAEDETVGR